MGKCNSVHAVYIRNEMGNNSWSVNKIHLAQIWWAAGISHYLFIYLFSYFFFKWSVLKVLWGLIGFRLSAVRNVEYYQGGATIIHLSSLF